MLIKPSHHPYRHRHSLKPQGLNLQTMATMEEAGPAEAAAAKAADAAEKCLTYWTQNELETCNED